MSFFRHCFPALPEAPDRFVSPPAFFRSLPVLETEDLVLRKPVRKDADDIYRYASDRQVSRYVLWDAHRSVAETRCFIRELRSDSGRFAH